MMCGLFRLALMEAELSQPLTTKLYAYGMLVRTSKLEKLYGGIHQQSFVCRRVLMDATSFLVTTEEHNNLES